MVKSNNTHHTLRWWMASFLRELSLMPVNCVTCFHVLESSTLRWWFLSQQIVQLQKCWRRLLCSDATLLDVCTVWTAPSPRHGAKQAGKGPCVQSLMVSGVATLNSAVLSWKFLRSSIPKASQQSQHPQQESDSDKVAFCWKAWWCLVATILNESCSTPIRRSASVFQSSSESSPWNWDSKRTLGNRTCPEKCVLWWSYRPNTEESLHLLWPSVELDTAWRVGTRRWLMTSCKIRTAAWLGHDLVWLQLYGYCTINSVEQKDNCMILLREVNNNCDYSWRSVCLRVSVRD